MGYGFTEKQAYRRTYSELQKLARELRRAGVSCHYRNQTLHSRAAPATKPGGPAFQLYYAHLRASNGESALTPRLYVRGKDGVEKNYSWMEFDEGLARIKAEFKEVTP